MLLDIIFLYLLYCNGYFMTLVILIFDCACFFPINIATEGISGNTSQGISIHEKLSKYIINLQYQNNGSCFIIIMP